MSNTLFYVATIAWGVSMMLAFWLGYEAGLDTLAKRKRARKRRRQLEVYPKDWWKES